MTRQEQLEQATGRIVSRETLDRLICYVSLLKSENQRQNLVSPSSLEAVWTRHILDCAQLVRFEPRVGSTWVDVGSGAGLPGIVIACLIEGPITLVEPRRLRANFLREAVATLGLQARVEQANVERIAGSYDVVTGRAVARLTDFLSMCDHLSTGKTVWVLPKGRGAQSELVEARAAWQGVFHVEQSVTDEDSHIIVGTGVRVKRQ